MKMNRLFVVDLLLLFLFIATATSGFGMHVAGHENNHSVWHNWAVAHIFFTLFFTITTIAHIYLHWNWYKSLFSKPLGKKSKITIIVTVLFVVLVISGTLAFVIPEGPNSQIGMAHYKIGVVSTIFFAGHIIKRHKVLLKGLFKKK